MINILKKILSPQKEAAEEVEEEVGSDFFPPAEEYMTDELFVKNFTDQGGKFLYCESEELAFDYLKKILAENCWQDVYASDSGLKERLVDYGVFYSEAYKQSHEVFFSSCEYLIADQGSIMICSNQLRGRNISELPDAFIIIATVDQFAEDRDAAMSEIKKNYKGHLPHGLTTIKGDHCLKSDEGIITGGGTSQCKNLYLLLIDHEE